MNGEILLASGSPRRRELLRGMGWNFRVVVPEADETILPEESPAELCVRLSGLKARAVRDMETNMEMNMETNKKQSRKNFLVIAADTVVVVDGSILGKPLDDDDALRMLRLLQGRSHEVLTGVSVLWGERSRSGFERTLVTFRPLSEAEMRAYAATGEGRDKAGAYAIQGRGSLLVSSIEGDYFNVVGLPLCRLGRMLEELGMDLIGQWSGNGMSQMEEKMRTVKAWERCS
ncbi:MAG: Maf family protein [Synergistaceae bacterium]|jgi:septum formation protein|nr:Maf family protein [Synergistaceae bacterium]